MKAIQGQASTIVVEHTHNVGLVRAQLQQLYKMHQKFECNLNPPLQLCKECVCVCDANPRYETMQYPRLNVIQKKE